MSSLRALDVRVRIGERAVLDGVDVALTPGELVAIVGPNGAGKTTLLRALAGDLAVEGQVLLDERPLSSYRSIDLARRRAVLPQHTTIEFAFTAGEVVAMGRAPHLGTPTERDDERVIDAALRAADAAHLAAREYRTLSGGEQARVNLARVLAQDTEYLLLDEPTAALDIRHQESVMALAARCAARGRCVAAVVHDLNLAAAYATRVVIIGDGAVAADGAPAAVLRADLLGRVYRYPVEVLTHPVRGCPLVIAAGAVPRAFAPRTATAPTERTTTDA